MVGLLIFVFIVLAVGLSAIYLSIFSVVFGYDKDDEYVDDSYLDRLDYDDWSGRD